MVIDVLEAGEGIIFYLAFVYGEVSGFVFAFRFDDADGFLVDEKDVIGRADVGKVFADGDADGGGEVEGGFVLKGPPAC